MKKVLLSLLGLVSVLVLGIIVYWFSGWLPLPTKVPQQSEVYQQDFQQASEQAMAELMLAQQQQQLPALTAAVAWRGKLIWVGAAGYADLASQTAATVQSQFRIGSTSKAVTATSLARAVAAGSVDLDSPISRYMPDLPNPAWKDFTLRQLMSHTAGMPGYGENTDRLGAIRTLLKQRNFSDVEQALTLFDESALLFSPGTGFHYSSFDVNLASAVLQNAVKQPFLQYLSQSVSQPLQLGSLSADYPEQFFPNRANFYLTHDGYAKAHWPVNLSQKWASGGLIASSADLARLGSAWFDPDFIPTAIQQEFWTAQKLSNGDVNEQFYALGWRHFSQDYLFCDKTTPLSQTVSFVHHGGVSDSAQSWLVLYPELQLVVAMNTNTVKEKYCDFAGQAARITRPFLQQIAPDWLVPKL
ncbi:serine hydrolase domain-containing protein [Rheinheimera maricola]|uniref:Beta-lactamase family protein n=1 Tax=Rheinheimera maricola TaxID=2793282 RepID=A0ABS7XA02_9GAMM|nr:serine hydrolase domain-containing protein [Rheinheimera maricola]MBZ9612386.1 beta-lactamase family protein [Rheinheimera maricola]